MHESYFGLMWYQSLFPSKCKTETQWTCLVVAVLNRIARQDVLVFPIVGVESVGKETKYPCNWLSSSTSFFTSIECSEKLGGILRPIGFKLISLKQRIYKNFKDVDAPVAQITPDNAITFLSEHEPFLKQLPCPIEDSSIGTVTNYLEVLCYCIKSASFAERLADVPLLLTKDGYLRQFSKTKPVILSAFSHLVSSPEHFNAFASEQLTNALASQHCHFFNQENPVVLPLKLEYLATFLPDIFKEHKPWNTTSNPVPWDPDKDDQVLAKWLVELWYFISSEHQTEPLNGFLEHLKSWPIFPVTSRNLVPVSLSKTILDLTELDSWTATQKRLVKVLRKLKCPEVDMKLISSKAANVSTVVKSYLAYPNLIDDVIIVLDYLMTRDTDIFGSIEAKEAELLLQFLQEDRKTLEDNIKNAPVLRKLPFYKTTDGRLIKLEGAAAVCQVPRGIPQEESHVWMEGTKYVFLEHCQKLEVIHQILGVQLKSQITCYVEFIFPKFNVLQTTTRLNHLVYMKNTLLGNPNDKQYSQLQSALQNLAFMPNEATGSLCKASHFYDPTNLVFQALLTKDKFPGMPFSSPEWILFLRNIGLRQSLSETQVLGFAKEIESQAVLQGVTKHLLERSIRLTTYIQQEPSLHEADFLQQLSAINFVVTHKVDENLNSVFEQFSNNQDPSGFLTTFRNSVPQEYEMLVWSAAALLPDWAVRFDEQISIRLGILKEPTLQQVVKHANNICSKFSKRTDMDFQIPLRELLSKIMQEIYKYLQQILEYDDHILQLLHDMPFALVENGGVFIQCKQLVFEMKDFEEQPPYLYRVPRIYGIYEDLLKRLGAVERAMPSQHVYILDQIWKKSCQEKEMHAEEKNKAKKAMFGFFRALKRLYDEDERATPQTRKCADSLKNVNTLHLPTQTGKLKPSNQLFHMYDCPQMKRRMGIVNSNYELIIDLYNGGFRYDSPEELLSYLPQHLQVNSITQVFKEELHAECLDKKCRLDGDGECSEASRLRDVLGSQHFIDGLIRILKAQGPKASLTEDLYKKIETQRTMFTIVCFETLETVMKKKIDDEKIEGSKISKSCFFIDDGNTVFLFIRHGAMGISRDLKLCEFICKHLNGTLEPIYVNTLIRVKEAVTIPNLLDELEIRRNVHQFSVEMLDEKPGTIIPPEKHYLLIMYEEFIFRSDEIVGYEEEDNLESDQGKYIYAKILEKLPSHSYSNDQKLEKRRNRKVTDKKDDCDSSLEREQIENPLLSRYLIDIGIDAPITVDVLDLYKMKRPQEVDDTTLDENGSTCDLSDVPYEGEDAAKPSSWEKIEKEIRRALADIMNLTKEKRHKAVRRLYLRWHPDKNTKEMEELANEAMTFIQVEFQRLSTDNFHIGTSNDKPFNEKWHDAFFSNTFRRGQRQRSAYDNYRQRNSSRSSEFHAPDPRMARIWIIQSRADLRSVEHLFAANDGLNWLICFQCSQVVEKALKAALYAACGMPDEQLMSHDLIWLAGELKNASNGPDVLSLSGELRNYHVPTRYPSKQAPAKPPKEVFTLEQAQRVYGIAKEVLRVLEEFIGILPN